MRKGNVMDVMDWVILASMGVLVVFFASAAVLEWMDRRRGARTSSLTRRVIQHPSQRQKVSAA